MSSIILNISHPKLMFFGHCWACLKADKWPQILAVLFFKKSMCTWYTPVQCTNPGLLQKSSVFVLWSILLRKTYEWAIAMGAWAWDWSSNMLIIGYPINRLKKYCKIHPPLTRNLYPRNRLRKYCKIHPPLARNSYQKHTPKFIHH